jgi:hypothetical protein
MGSSRRRNSTRAPGARSVKPSHKSRTKPALQRPQPPKRLGRPTLIDLRDELSIIAATIAVVQAALMTDEDNEAPALTLLERVIYPLNKIMDGLDQLAAVARKVRS